MNIALFYSLYNLSRYDLIADIAMFFSYFMMYAVPVFLVVWSIFILQRKIFSFSLIFLSVIFSWVTAALLKIAFHIPRPFIQEGIAPLVYETGFSFPSEHMTVFSALAMASYFLNKKLGIILFTGAFFVGVSRIVIGVHTPIDILGGFFVGFIIANIIIHFFKKI